MQCPHCIKLYTRTIFANSLTSYRDDLTVKFEVHTPFRFEAVDLEQNLHGQ